MERNAESFIYIQLLFMLMYITSVFSRQFPDCSRTFYNEDINNITWFRNASLEEGPHKCHYRIKAPKRHVIFVNITELNVFPQSKTDDKPCVVKVVQRGPDSFGIEFNSEHCCSRTTPFQLESIDNKLKLIVQDSQECLISSFNAIFSFHKKDDSKHICDIECLLLHGTTSKSNNSIMSTTPSTVQNSETDSKFYSNLTDKPTVVKENQQFDFIIIWILAPTCFTLFLLVVCCVVMFSYNNRPRRGDQRHHQVYVPSPVGNQTPPVRQPPLLIYQNAFSQVVQQERLREQGKIIRGNNSLTENYPASVKLPDGEGKTPKRIFLDVYLENEPSSIRAAPNVVVGSGQMPTDLLQSSPSLRSNLSRLSSDRHRTPSPRLKHVKYLDSETRTSLNILDTEELPPYNKAMTGQRLVSANAITTKDDTQRSAKDRKLSEKIKDKSNVKGKENDTTENNNS
ncbi:uncharacterized protein [Antedon mediterranea]|uniref:uncharacterized protein n=1 Tax=Antedon mediterranea TaxID=105859 RepID=UPI003AF780F6